MATVKEVLEKYNVLVPFPITPAKIRHAGKDPDTYLRQIVFELKKCTDADEPLAKAMIDSSERLLETV